MTRAQCYYEILGVSEVATSEEIKKAYKAQALVWHPDKNQANPEEAHARFQAILKAYETLSDDKERDWYDRHKDLILSGGDESEAGKCLNLFQYFSSSCYANFDDSEDGFYTVYRDVFDQIAEEERQAMEQHAKFQKRKNGTSSPDGSFPTFGNSESVYEDVVRPFYAFWSGFCTHLTFDHLDKYNTTEAENRRILRLMEKENKKIKDTAKKERNTNVRNLVEFIKKRDRRLKAHKLLVEQQNELNRQKTLEKRRHQLARSQKQNEEYKPSAWLDLNDVEEQLKQLEDEYEDFDIKKNRKAKSNNQRTGGVGSKDGDNIDEDDESIVDNHPKPSTTEEIPEDSLDTDEEEDENYFCPACNKDFRSINAFENHESSKKHKQNVQRLTKILRDDESRVKS